ncbi:MAG: GNAT family N-acetyltransferase [Muribaculaceae bacterium]|nr:GNAT family N-acetyltransferase [Muribaculaceae bacterium]
MTFLENNNIRLRAVEPSDAEEMWKMECDSTQWIHNAIAAPYSLRSLREYAENYDADPIRSGQLRLIIETVDSNAISGIIDLYDISAFHRTALLGVYVKQDFRGKGYASQAIDLACSYMKNLLHFHQIGAKIMGTNKASVSLFEKAGFIHRGTLPEWYVSPDKRADLLVYSKLL